MKRTTACLVDLLAFVPLVGCKGGADKNGARENKGDIETSGAASILYAANDRLYLIRVSHNGAEDVNATVGTERLAEGKDIFSSLFSSNGGMAGYLRQDGFYGCSIGTGKEELPLNEALSFVPDGKEGFYTNSRKTGTVRVHMSRGQEEVWRLEPVGGGWTQYEKLALSPGGEKLALVRRRHVGRRKDLGLSLFGQNRGI